MIPLGHPDEVLQLAAVLIVPIGNRLNVLARQIGQQTAHHGQRMPPLLGPNHPLHKRFQKRHQPTHHPPKHLRTNFTLRQHFFLAQRKPSIHRLAS